MDLGFLEEAPIPTYVVRREADDFVLEAVNASARKRNPGLTSLIGTAMTRLYSDQPQAIEDARRAARENVSVERDLPVRRYDRTEATQYVRLRFVPAPPDHLLLFMLELPSTELARVALSETEARYQSLVASLPDAVVLRGADGRVLFCNELAVSLLNAKTPAELLGQIDILPRDAVVLNEAGELIRPEDFPSRRVLVTGKPAPGEVFAYLSKGDLRWLRIAAQPILSEAGAVKGSVTTFTDISDRVNAQKALRESAARLDLALSAARMGVWEYEPASDSGWWSPNLFDIFDIKDPMPGMAQFLRRVHPDDRQRIGARALALAEAADGDAFEDECRMIGDDQVTRWARLQGRLTHTGGRRILAGTVMDVTAQRLLEEQLHRASRLESIGRLAGGVAHDFNNLLAAMLGSLELLDGEVTGAARQDLATIRHSALRARDLTRQLLAFARKQPVQWKTIDLALLVKDVELLLRRLVGPSIAIEIHSLGPAFVSADPALLEQVLVNLVVNARDAMPNGGNLRIGVEACPPVGSDWIGAHFAALSVTDSGTGMDEATRRRIFEPFFTTKASGTGLGLASSYGIIQQHRGDITVESTPGHGTSFIVTLPCLTPDAQTRHATVAPPAAATAKGTVLVVDDEDAVRKTTARLVKSLGYQVFDASTVEEAMRHATAHAGVIDMLLCDIAMPGEDGRTLAAELVRLRPELKVLFMSGYSSDMQEMRLDGALFVQKPFSRDELAHKLAELAQ
ncbi:MAG TPA: ATP-binding protein [Polyangiaceae bacterium]|nr:ATP-binding protein [Polyangiaceae bacterium]